MRKLGRPVRILLALLGVLVGWTVASYAFMYFTANEMASDVATRYSIIVLLAVAATFGLVAFKVKLRGTKIV